MTATVINPIAKLSTNSLNFANQKVGTTSAPQTVTITSAGTTPLVIKSFSTTATFADATGTSCTSTDSRSGLDVLDHGHVHADQKRQSQRNVDDRGQRREQPAIRFALGHGK